MQVFQSNSQKMTYQSFGEGPTAFVWAHGWGGNRNSLLGLAQSLSFMGKHYLIDFPGFGDSPIPDQAWVLDDYARFTASFIDSLPETNVIWVSHSFGGRVGIKLAATKQPKIAKYILIGSHGLPRRRPLWQKILFHSRIRLYKFLKFFVRTPEMLDRLRSHFGSPDYRNAGPMRPIFMNIIHENLQDIAAQVDQPVLLIYGDKDDETPPNIGQRLAKLMRNAQFRLVADFDHYTILTSGKHQVSQLIKNFVTQG